MGWGGLDAPAPYAGTRWGAGWSPLLLLTLPASEDSSFTIQIKQMTKGTRVHLLCICFQYSLSLPLSLQEISGSVDCNICSLKEFCAVIIDPPCTPPTPLVPPMFPPFASHVPPMCLPFAPMCPHVPRVQPRTSL